MSFLFLYKGKKIQRMTVRKQLTVIPVFVIIIICTCIFMQKKLNKYLISSKTLNCKILMRHFLLLFKILL